MAKLLTTLAFCAGVLVAGISAAAAQSPATASPQATAAPPQAINQTQPLQLLNEAKQIVDMLSDTAGDPRALADLRRDFTTLQAMYLAQTSGSPAVVASSRTGITTGASTGAVGTAGAAGSQPVGTSGSLQPPAPADWRTQYAMVSTDIAALAAAGNTGPRSDVLHTSLEELRSRLEKFFTATLGQAALAPASGNAPLPPSPQAVTPAPAPQESGANPEALVLLQRMEELLNRTTDDQGRSLKEAGLVKIERANVDEIKAVITELKSMLRK